MAKKKNIQKVKKPLYKKWWFWVIVVFALGGIGNAIGGDTADNPAESSVVSQDAPSPSYRGTLPSQNPSQPPAQTQAPEESNAPEETVQPTADPTPKPTQTPSPTPNPTPEPTPTPIPAQSQGGSRSSGGTSGGGSGNGSNFQTWDNPNQQQTSDNWVLNTSSMRIHYPSCSSVASIAPQNYATSSSSLNDLLSLGYSKCGRCFK